MWHRILFSSVIFQSPSANRGVPSPNVNSTFSLRCMRLFSLLGICVYIYLLYGFSHASTSDEQTRSDTYLHVGGSQWHQVKRGSSLMAKRLSLRSTRRCLENTGYKVCFSIILGEACCIMYVTQVLATFCSISSLHLICLIKQNQNFVTSWSYYRNCRAEKKEINKNITKQKSYGLTGFKYYIEAKIVLTLSTDVITTSVELQSKHLNLEEWYSIESVIVKLSSFISTAWYQFKLNKFLTPCVNIIHTQPDISRIPRWYVW